MADTKAGRDEKGRDEENRQRESELDEELERGGESEPEDDEEESADE